jgi:GBP family porin
MTRSWQPSTAYIKRIAFLPVALKNFHTLRRIKLNKKLVGLGMLLAANGAFAQTASSTSVELYGILDVAVGRVENSLNTDPNFPASVNPVSATSSAKIQNSVTGMFNGGISDSRWGIRGSEDLGGGMKAVFTLESGINLPSGNLNNGTDYLASNSPNATSAGANTSLNGQLFNRQAFAGLSDAKLGTITFGRNYAPIFDICVNYDPVQNAQLFSPLGFSGAYGGGGGVSEDTRIDNSVKYKNTIGAINVGALYKFGGIAGSNSAQSGYALNAGYDDGAFGVQAAYESFKDALKTGVSTVAGDISLTNYDTSAYFIAAKYQFGPATVKGGFESYKLKQASDMVNAGAGSIIVNSLYNYPVASTVNYGYSANQPDLTTDLWFVGGDYNFSQALNLALGFYDVKPQSGGAQDDGGNAFYYSALVDYHFSKRTDVYAGYMFSQYKGSTYHVDNADNYITAVGIRTKF